MTIQQKVKNMQARMGQMRDSEKNDRKKMCFGLLHDAVMNTGPRIDELPGDSLVGYIELASLTVVSDRPDFLDLRNRLMSLGFNTNPVN